MTNMSQWDNAIERLFREIDKQVDDGHARVVELIFNKIVEFSPIYTGLYAANHEIHLSKRGYRVLPSEDEREDIGQFSGLIFENASEQLDELTTKPLPRVIEIGNATSYGEIVENYGAGSSGNPPVYFNATQIGIMMFNSEQKR